LGAKRLKNKTNLYFRETFHQEEEMKEGKEGKMDIYRAMILTEQKNVI
jgi:hypothetical protein